MIKIVAIILLTTLSGQVQDKPEKFEGMVFHSETKEPVPFAFVMVLDSSGMQITGTATDFDGRFTLEDIHLKRATCLKVSAVGFEECIMDSINRVYPFDDLYGIPLDLKTHKNGLVDPNFVYKIPKDFPSNMPILWISKEWPSDMPIAGKRRVSPADSTMIKLLRKIPEYLEEK